MSKKVMIIQGEYTHQWIVNGGYVDTLPEVLPLSDYFDYNGLQINYKGMVFTAGLVKDYQGNVFLTDTALSQRMYTGMDQNRELVNYCLEVEIPEHLREEATKCATEEEPDDVG